MNRTLMKIMSKMNNKTYYILFLFVLVLAQTVFAQNETKSQADTSAAEIILGEILIEGVIEKPNVSILPTRMETDFERIEYINRGFAQELKALPPRSSLLPRDFANLKEIERARQAWFKKR